VFNRLVGDAALVELLPAIRVLVEGKGVRDVPRAPATTRAARARDALSGVGSDGLTDEERKALADRFNALAGAPLGAEDLTRLREYAAAGRFPRRPLRPAG
jgi:hypothetical protein